MLTADYLRSLLDYSPETGEFRWKVVRRSAHGRTKVGSVAGFVRSDGYVFIGIDGRAHMAQRLAWLYMTGEWPAGPLDHVSRNRADNRWINIRPATRSENNRNKSLRSDNVSGTTGVSWDSRRGKWSARIRVGGKYLMLGRFDTLPDAVTARLEAERLHYGEFAPQAEKVRAAA